MRRSAADEVYSEVRRALRGGLAPGTPLREEDFAAASSRSRAAVREALMRARAEGILTPQPKRGVAVPERSPEILAQLWACLAGLEEVLVARLATLDADLSTLEESLGADDDLAFHRALGALLSHEPVGLLHAIILAHLEQDVDSATEHVVGTDTFQPAHRELVDAVQASASDAAARFAREHIEELAAAAALEPHSRTFLEDGPEASWRR